MDKCLRFSVVLFGILVISTSTVSCNDNNYSQKIQTYYRYDEKFGEMVESCSIVTIENFDVLGRTSDIHTYDCEGTRLNNSWNTNETHRYIGENIHVKIIYTDNEINHIDSIVTSNNGKKVTTHTHYPVWLEWSEDKETVEWKQKIDLYDNDGELIESTEYDPTGEITLKDTYNRSEKNKLVFKRYLFDSLYLETVKEFDIHGNPVKITSIEYDYNPLKHPKSEGRMVKREITYYKNEYDSNGNVLRRDIFEVENREKVLDSYIINKYDIDNHVTESLSYDEVDQLYEKTILRYKNNLKVEEIEHKYDCKSSEHFGLI